jgi:hypothetical protein
MKFLFGFLTLFFFVSHSSFINAQDQLKYDRFMGYCSIEKMDNETGQLIVYNWVWVKMEAYFHEPNDSWEVILTYYCDGKINTSQLYLKEESSNGFTGLVKGTINCQGTQITQNPSNGFIQGTMVTIKPTYTLAFKNMAFYPIDISNDSVD